MTSPIQYVKSVASRVKLPRWQILLIIFGILVICGIVAFTIVTKTGQSSVKNAAAMRSTMSNTLVDASASATCDSNTADMTLPSSQTTISPITWAATGSIMYNAYTTELARWNITPTIVPSQLPYASGGTLQLVRKNRCYDVTNKKCVPAINCVTNLNGIYNTVTIIGIPTDPPPPIYKWAASEWVAAGSTVPTSLYVSA